MPVDTREIREVRVRAVVTGTVLVEVEPDATQQDIREAARLLIKSSRVLSAEVVGYEEFDLDVVNDEQEAGAA